MDNHDADLVDQVGRETEYEQICEDWRHRDAMIWQSVAVSVAISGGIFTIIFSKDFCANCVAIFSLKRESLLLLFAALFDFLMLVKIVKDHYYQQGSAELISQFGGKSICGSTNLRIYRPLVMREMCALNCFGYKLVSAFSAYGLFYLFQLLLTVAVILLFAKSI